MRRIGVTQGYLSALENRDKEPGAGSACSQLGKSSENPSIGY